MCTADGMAPNNQAANRYSAGIRDESSSYRELNTSTRSTNVCLFKITGHGRTFRLSRPVEFPRGTTSIFVIHLSLTQGPRVFLLLLRVLNR